MSILNIGAVISDNLGGLFTWALGVTANDFRNLWMLVLVCNICSLLPIPLLAWLVPTQEQLTEIRPVKDEDAVVREPLTANKPLGDHDE